MGYFINSCTVLLVILCVHYGCCKKTIPPYVKLCHRSVPNLNDCIKESVEQLRPYLKGGIPELYLPPLDPLILTEAGLDNGESFKASFKNIKIFHADEFKMENLTVDLDKLHVELIISFPKLRITSEYNIKGRILILTLDGRGPADGNFTNVAAKLVVNGKRFFKKGNEYGDLSDSHLDLQLGKPVFRFDNVFRDNKELNDQTNKIVNENIVDILDELKPVIYKVVEDFGFGIVRRIFAKYSLNELFPN